MLHERLRLEGGASGGASDGASGLVTGGERNGALCIELEEGIRRIDLEGFDRIVVFGAGKASARMALGLESVLGNRIDGGLVVVKDGYSEKLHRIDLVEASHPVPDHRSMAAAERILDLARSGDEKTLFIGLLSGGGSSLLCLPSPGLSLEDKAEATGLLVSCGADIGEINCVRKHLSSIKGGRLAAALGKATSLVLVLSDVVGDDPAVIASGLTAPDPTSFADAQAVIERYGLASRMPPAVMRHICAGLRGEIEETPKAGDPAFDRIETIVIGSNRQALAAASSEARRLGYNTLVLGSRFEGEARELGRFFFSLADGISSENSPLAPPACIISGGESTVTVKGPGRGGRNQEMALAFLAAAEKKPQVLAECCFLSAGSDGSDGPTEAAGAFACSEVFASARAQGLSCRAYLAQNDSYGFFSRAEGLLVTGPTNTNVCDLQILLVGGHGA
jgi:hydroxypyruvate reductase